MQWKIYFNNFLFKIIIQNNYKDVNLILFETKEINLELEDEVRLQLFIDNLRLHKIHKDLNKQDNLTKYLRKNFKILIEWRSDQSSNLSYLRYKIKI